MPLNAHTQRAQPNASTQANAFVRCMIYAELERSKSVVKICLDCNVSQHSNKKVLRNERVVQDNYQRVRLVETGKSPRKGKIGATRMFILECAGGR